MNVAIRTTLPDRAGVGLKSEHVEEIISTRPDVGFFEVHAENYMGDGGAPHRALAEIVSQYPLSLHGVGLSIGAEGPLDRTHLGRLRRLIDCYRPQSFSEHLAWSTHDSAFFNDLLPLPYTQATLRRVSNHINEVQQTLGRRMLLENPSTYILFEESTIEEVEFLTRIANQTGCGLLLDVNNVMVSAVNHRQDPYAYIDRFPVEHVGEIHLAGYDETVDNIGDRLLIDAHDRRISEDVFELYLHTIARTGPRPTLIEWDNQIPELSALLTEARRADVVLEEARSGCGVYAGRR
ncbi:MAG: DUF692 family multinuclear iron-containing protein [Rhizobiaceae bacterium]